MILQDLVAKRCACYHFKSSKFTAIVDDIDSKWIRNRKSTRGANWRAVHVLSCKRAGNLSLSSLPSGDCGTRKREITRRSTSSRNVTSILSTKSWLIASFPTPGDGSRAGGWRLRVWKITVAFPGTRAIFLVNVGKPFHFLQYFRSRVKRRACI